MGNKTYDRHWKMLQHRRRDRSFQRRSFPTMTERDKTATTSKTTIKPKILQRKLNTKN